MQWRRSTYKSRCKWRWRLARRVCTHLNYKGAFYHRLLWGKVLNRDVKTWQWVEGAWKLSGGRFSLFLSKSWEVEALGKEKSQWQQGYKYRPPTLPATPPAKLDWSIPSLFPSNAPFHNSSVGFPCLCLQAHFSQQRWKPVMKTEVRKKHKTQKRGFYIFNFTKVIAKHLVTKILKRCFQLVWPLFLQSDFQEFYVSLKQGLGIVALKFQD